MKKIIILLAIMLPFAAAAQLYVEMGSGVEHIQQGLQTNNNGSTQSIYPVLKIAAGAEFNNSVTVETALQAAITRVKGAGAYFGFKGGYNFGNIVPMVGIYYGYMDADNTDKNGTHIGYSLKYQRFINDQGALFAEGLYINKTAQLSIGIHFAF